MNADVQIPKWWTHPRERAARVRVAGAVKDGRLVRPNNCSVCGKRWYVEAHHPDYRYSLKIEWLCSKCHRAADRRDHPKSCYRRRMKRQRFEAIQRHYARMDAWWAEYYRQRQKEKERKLFHLQLLEGREWTTHRLTPTLMGARQIGSHWGNKYRVVHRGKVVWLQPARAKKERVA